jgi:hypothetical protein
MGIGDWEYGFAVGHGFTVLTQKFCPAFRFTDNLLELTHCFPEWFVEANPP